MSKVQVVALPLLFVFTSIGLTSETVSIRGVTNTADSRRVQEFNVDERLTSNGPRIADTTAVLNACEMMGTSFLVMRLVSDNTSIKAYDLKSGEVRYSGRLVSSTVRAFYSDEERTLNILTEDRGGQRWQKLTYNSSTTSFRLSTSEASSPNRWNQVAKERQAWHQAISGLGYAIGYIGQGGGSLSVEKVFSDGFRGQFAALSGDLTHCVAFVRNSSEATGDLSLLYLTSPKPLGGAERHLIKLERNDIRQTFLVGSMIVLRYANGQCEVRSTEQPGEVRWKFNANVLIEPGVSR